MYCHSTPHFPDSVGRSENGTGELTAIIAPFAFLLPPWLIDGCLKVAHLSAMAAKACKSSDYSSEPLAVPGQPDRGAKVHGETRHFSPWRRYFLDSIANSGGKLPSGARVYTKPQPAAWHLLDSEADFEIISTYILDLITPVAA